ncbi:MAG: DUF1318 domain-containing protein [Sphingomicrobium sp.]
MTGRALLAAALFATPLAAPMAAQTPAGPAVAEAKASGLAGERYDGYVGLVADAGPRLRHQVQSINILRRSLYSRFAIARGVAQADVGITAGCQLLGTVQVGERYYAPDNSWHLRRPGQPAPIPDYCR